MAELKNDGLGEDYLDDLLNSVSKSIRDEKEEELPVTENRDSTAELSVTENKDSTGESARSFVNDKDDIAQLLSMLDTEGMEEDLKEEDIDKIAQELEDIPDISEVEEKTQKGKKEKKKKKEKKEKKKLFGKKDKKSKESEPLNRNLSPDDNEEIIKSVEDTFDAGFDLSDLAGLDDLDDIEDRSAKKKAENIDEDDMTEEELAALKAERKAEKERKKQEKAEKKAEKKKLKQEKKAAKKARREEKKKEKEKANPKIPEPKIKVSVPVLLLLVSLMAAVVLICIFGGKQLWYSSHIDDATSLLIEKKYSEAYSNLNGLKIKDKDMGLYRQLRTLMFVQKEYDSYRNCLKLHMDMEALDSLLKGVENYQAYQSDAEQYGVASQAKGIYESILGELSSIFGLDENSAKELANTKDSGKYSKRIADIVAQNRQSIENAKIN